MRPLAIKRDANAVPGREDRARLRADRSCRISQHVLRERDIRFGDTVAQTAVYHRLRATGNLFRRLEQCYVGSAPRPLSLSEQFGCSQQTRHMHVMAASMGDADCVPRVINSGACRSVGESCVFPHGKCVHVSSREYGLPFTIAQDTHDSCTTNPFDDFIAEFLEFRRHQRSRFSFLKTELWIRVYILVNTFLPNGGFPQTGENLC